MIWTGIIEKAKKSPPIEVGVSKLPALLESVVPQTSPAPPPNCVFGAGGNCAGFNWNLSGEAGRSALAASAGGFVTERVSRSYSPV